MRPGRRSRRQWSARRPRGTYRPVPAVTQVWAEGRRRRQLSPRDLRLGHLEPGGGKLPGVRSPLKLWGEGTPRLSSSSFTPRRRRKRVPAALAFLGVARSRGRGRNPEPATFIIGRGEPGSSKVFPTTPNPRRSMDRRGARGGRLHPLAGRWLRMGPPLKGFVNAGVRGGGTARTHACG